MIESLLRENIRNLKPYSSARSEFKGKADIFLDANENPFKGKYSRYPDPLAMNLKRLLSNHKQISLEQIFIGNGSDEAIDLLIRAFCEPGKDAIRVLDPSYGMYEVSASINDIKILRSPLTQLFGLDPKFSNTEWSENEKILFICSPNNPSGNCFDIEIIRSLIETYPGIVVVDEAYIDFAEQTSATVLVEDYNNIVILQTMSKASGSAGLRIGMAFAQKEIINIFNRVKPPYNVSQIAQEAAISQLNNRAEIAAQINKIKAQRAWLENELKQLTIVKKVFPSQANFLLVRVSDAESTYHNLMNKGIIVRKRDGMLHCDQTIRITVGTAAENRKLIETLKNSGNETGN